MTRGLCTLAIYHILHCVDRWNVLNNFLLSVKTARNSIVELVGSGRQVCIVLQWCYGCYSNHAGGSQPIPNLLGTTSSFMIFPEKIMKTACCGKVLPKNRRGPVFWDTMYNKSRKTQVCFHVPVVRDALLCLQQDLDVQLNTCHHNMICMYEQIW